MDYMLSGPIEILLVTGADYSTCENFKQIVGPTDPVEAKQKAPESFRAKYGIDKIKNEVQSSDDPRAANRDRDVLELPIPVKEPEFQFDKYKVTFEALLKFIFPPHLEHPSITGRLDIFALYGPIVNYHSVDNGCFCRKCSKLCKLNIQNKQAATCFTRQTISKPKKIDHNSLGTGKLAPAPNRVVKEQDLVDM